MERERSQQIDEIILIVNKSSSIPNFFILNKIQPKNITATTARQKHRMRIKYSQGQATANSLKIKYNIKA